jgi:hypothetical protein
VAGLRGSALSSVTVEGLRAWTSEVDEGSWTREDLLAHHAVVSRLADVAETCLPARFGTQLSEALLAARQDELLAALERVRGRAELAVTVLSGRAHEAPKVHQVEREELLTQDAPIGAGETASSPAAKAPFGAGETASPPAGGALVGATGAGETAYPPTGASGTAYLRARAGRIGFARLVSERVERIAGDALAGSEHRLAPSEGVLLSSALLVERSAAENVKARLYREVRDVRILVNGPWPAYSFAAIGAPMREA